MTIDKPTEQSTLLNVCCQLGRTHDGSFALIIPPSRGLTPAFEGMFAQEDYARGGVADDFSTGKPKLTLDQELKSDSSGTVIFPTPAGTTWEDIKIQFRDNHTVTVWARDETHRYTYGEMGMMSKKDKMPTKQWRWLLEFADSHGNINWENKSSEHRLKKQKQLLSKRLRKFFHLKGDPIYWDKTAGAYCCRFQILPEGAVDG
ncbi:hypothetical protein ACFLQY_03955 [Verrucomicrobiota bacterium]